MQITGAACHAPRMPSGRRPPRAESVAGRANGRPPLRERVSASLQTSPDLGIQTDPPGSVGEECGLPIPRPANKSRPHHCPFEPTPEKGRRGLQSGTLPRIQMKADLTPQRSERDFGRGLSSPYSETALFRCLDARKCLMTANADPGQTAPSEEPCVLHFFSP